MRLFRHVYLILLPIVFSGCAPKEPLQSTYKQKISNLKEGSVTAFLAETLMEAGAEPMEKNGTYHISIAGKASLGKQNRLLLNGKAFQMKKDYFPLPYSYNGKIKGEVVKAGFGIVAPEYGHNDYKGIHPEGKVLAIELSLPKGFAAVEYSSIEKKIATAVKKGAAGIIFINSDIRYPEPVMNLTKQVTTYDIPIIYARGMAYKLIMDGTMATADLSVDIKKEKIIAGYKNNNKKKTLVIGSFYDKVNNTAGIATYLSLVKKLAKAEAPSCNYLFLSFPGKEDLYAASFLSNLTSQVDAALFYDLSNLPDKNPEIIVKGTDMLKNIASKSESKVIIIDSGDVPVFLYPFKEQQIPLLYVYSANKEADIAKSNELTKGEINVLKWAIQLVGKTCRVLQGS